MFPIFYWKKMKPPMPLARRLQAPAMRRSSRCAAQRDTTGRLKRRKSCHPSKPEMKTTRQGKRQRKALQRKMALHRNRNGKAHASGGAGVAGEEAAGTALL